jgi:hypothetical protein
MFTHMGQLGWDMWLGKSDICVQACFSKRSSRNLFPIFTWMSSILLIFNDKRISLVFLSHKIIIQWAGNRGRWNSSEDSIQEIEDEY